jgi:hypothetical protein
MNRPFGVPALAGPDRLKAGLQTSGVPTDRFMVPMHAQYERRLSTNICADFDSKLTTGQMLADKLATFGGCWRFRKSSWN